MINFSDGFNITFFCVAMACSICKLTRMKVVIVEKKVGRAVQKFVSKKNRYLGGIVVDNREEADERIKTQSAEELPVCISH